MCQIHLKMAKRMLLGGLEPPTSRIEFIELDFCYDCSDRSSIKAIGAVITLHD